MEFVDVLIPVELKISGFTTIFWVKESNLTFIDVDVPVPTDKSGLTFKDIWSPTFNWCDVDTETTDDILSIFALTWGRFDSIE